MPVKMVHALRAMTNKLREYRHTAVVLGVYLFLSFAGCVMVAFRIAVWKDRRFTFLIWNLFLTWVPVLLSVGMRAAYAYLRKGPARTAIITAAGAVWIAFYPNAPYILTDFIHLSSANFMALGGRSMSFFVWYDFIMISLFILTGFFLGFISLYLVHRLIEYRFRRLFGWLFAFGVLFLSSFGIYLGRFIRWNSWDIVANPAALLSSILESIHRYALAFTVTFGLFLCLAYLGLYSLTMLGADNAAAGLRKKP